MPSNSAKWLAYVNGLRLDGPDDGVHQNLAKLQQLIADEQDVVLADLVGDAVRSGFVVSLGTGLGVSIAAGSVFIGGQHARKTGPTILGGLPPNTTGLKVYLGLAGAFDADLRAWPPTFAFTDGALPASTLLLALVNTGSSGVTAITDQRALAGYLIDAPTDGQKAALAGTAGPPSDTNRYVTKEDPLLPTQGQKAALAGTAGPPSDTNRFITDADTRLLDTEAAAALVGTAGEPSGTNPFVTTQDNRLSNARVPLAHADSHAADGDDPIAHNTLAGLAEGDPHPQYHKIGEVRRLSIETVIGNPSSSPNSGFMGHLPTVDFLGGGGNNEIVHAVFSLPVEMDPAQPSSLKVTSAVSTAGSGTVRTAGNYLRAAVDEDLSAAGVAFGATLTPHAQASRRKTDILVPFAASTFTAGDVVVLRLYRDRVHAANTHTGVWRLVTLEFEYQTRRP